MSARDPGVTCREAMREAIADVVVGTVDDVLDAVADVLDEIRDAHGLEELGPGGTSLVHDPTLAWVIEELRNRRPVSS